MGEGLAILIIVLIIIGFVFRKTAWWHIPWKEYIKTHLRSKSTKELELRFQEAVKVNVLKSIIISFVVAVSFLLLTAVGKPLYQMQVISYYTEFVRDKEAYKKSSDAEKDKLMEDFFGTKDMARINQSNQDDIEAVTGFFVIVLGIFSYVGVLKRCRLTAIYEVIDEREEKIEPNKSIQSFSVDNESL
ncbi:hypothetical protein LIT97_14785 (plasmid) [Enterococcus faecalis]|uniref:hypothetical protein n=1 Tax=Enterococcus faecalis TaxID=1351 RepID=UPI001BE07CA5|nr:hypothetical protein [Enterococcus faecalis]MBT2155148.1 hypothetical protein [Enterococcus faecalis]UDM48402.1 hypothetical protein LIT97_14785 [Enterococcus faecalis]HBI2046970.1 hypothetical protein [Enterococcus faecalis]